MPKRNILDSWIDQERLDILIQGLQPKRAQESGALVASEAPTIPADDVDSDADDAPEGLLADALQIPAISDRTRVSEAEAMTASKPTSAKPEINPLLLYFPPPSGSLESRALQLATWARDTGEASAAFVVDAYGAVLAGAEGLDDVFLAAVSNLADAMGRGMHHLSRPDQGALHVELENKEVLSLVQAKWDMSTVALGVLGSAPLPRELAVFIRKELAKLTQSRRRERD